MGLSFKGSYMNHLYHGTISCLIGRYRGCYPMGGEKGANSSLSKIDLSGMLICGMGDICWMKGRFRMFPGWGKGEDC